MKNLLFYICLLIFINVYSLCFSQNYQWAKRIGSSNWDQGYSIAVDDTGNVYVAGSFSGVADFDPGTGISNLTPIGQWDVFFAKYDNNGNFIWAKNIGSTGQDNGFSLAIDSLGYIYISGVFSATADFDPSNGIANLTVVDSSNIFFAKYDNNGNYVWAKSIGSVNVGVSYNIAIDNNRNICITGYFQGTADFDPGNGTVNLTAIGMKDIFFAKYDTSGNYIFAKRIGSSNVDYGFSIAVDKEDNIYITGNFRDSVDFDTGFGTVVLISAGYEDVFFAKYDSSGNNIWAKNIGGTNGDWCRSISVDNYENVYITGSFYGTADFDPNIGIENLTSVGNKDIFFAKYDNTGNYLWAKNIGSTDSDEGKSGAIDSFGNLYIVGVFSNVADFDPGSGTAYLISLGFYDAYFAKYDINGNYVWAKKISGTDNESAYDITIDKFGNLLITGEFMSYSDFDPSNGTATLSTIGMSDIFIAKYGTVTGFDELKTDEINELNIYPNPTSEYISISTSLEISKVTILNIQGKQMLELNVKNKNFIELDVSELLSGVYLVKTQTVNSVETKILIVK